MDDNIEIDVLPNSGNPIVKIVGHFNCKYDAVKFIEGNPEVLSCTVQLNFNKEKYIEDQQNEIQVLKVELDVTSRALTDCNMKYIDLQGKAARANKKIGNIQESLKKIGC